MWDKFRDDAMLVPIDVYGTSQQAARHFDAILDTGYAGYLTLPYAEAFPIGLVLRGQQSYTLANGTTSSHFICVGTVTFENTSTVVPIDVQSGGPILVGVQLLKKLGLVLEADFAQETFELRPANKKRVKPLNVKLNI